MVWRYPTFDLFVWVGGRQQWMPCASSQFAVSNFELSVTWRFWVSGILLISTGMGSELLYEIWVMERILYWGSSDTKIFLQLSLMAVVWPFLGTANKPGWSHWCCLSYSKVVAHVACTCTWAQSWLKPYLHDSSTPDSISQNQCALRKWSFHGFSIAMNLLDNTWNWSVSWLLDLSRVSS